MIKWVGLLNHLSIAPSDGCMSIFLTLKADASVPSLAPSSHDAEFVDELERNGRDGIMS